MLRAGSPISSSTVPGSIACNNSAPEYQYCFGIRLLLRPRSMLYYTTCMETDGVVYIQVKSVDVPNGWVRPNQSAPSSRPVDAGRGRDLPSYTDPTLRMGRPAPDGASESRTARWSHPPLTEPKTGWTGRQPGGRALLHAVGGQPSTMDLGSRSILSIARFGTRTGAGRAASVARRERTPAGRWGCSFAVLEVARRM